MKFSYLLACLLCIASFSAHSQSSAVIYDHPQPIRITIIIDDIGDNWRAAKRLLDLPAPIAFAILPGTPFAERVANYAKEQGQSVMLHLPMHTHDHRELGPMGLTIDMTETEIKSVVRRSIESIPHIQGLNNHMGSLLTRHPGHMQWVMEAMSEYEDLFFIDSRTSVHTVALDVALEMGIPSTRRDVFLDPDSSIETVEKQWKWLLQLANRQGHAVAIGHPYESTISVLEKEIPKLNNLPQYRVTHVKKMMQNPVDGLEYTRHAAVYVDD